MTSAKVFLSYQRRDFELAKRVSDSLRHSGFAVWWDQEITPREPWDKLIERELSAADFVLVLWTANSIESDWVRAEAHYARSCQPSKLVQVRFDGCAIPVAYGLIQYVDLDRVRPDRSPDWSKLMRWLRVPAKPLSRRPPLVSPPPIQSEFTKHEMAMRLGEAEAWLPGKRIKLDFGRDGVVILDGIGCQVTQQILPADTSIKVSWEDWQAMANGTLDGMTAFMKAKLKVEGDMSNAMQLQSLLAKLSG